MTERFDEFLLRGAPPEADAVVEHADGGVRIVSYGQLRRMAARYADQLYALDLDIGERVIVESDTSAQAIALLAACSSLGLAFVPASPETPDARLAAIAEAAEPVLHLHAARARREELPARPGDGRFDAEGIHLESAPRPKSRRRREIVATDTAYIIFTSGTTGRPKGVVMSHRAVVSFYRGMLAQHIAGPGDRIASTSPLQFDFSLLDIGLALGSGAAVVPVPRAALRWPTRFLKVLAETGATHVNGVPSIWRQALRHIPERLARLTNLRAVLFCGEEFPLAELRQLQRLHPRARLINCYGATESMAASFADVPNPLSADMDRLSIGHGHLGAELMIIDDAGRPITAAHTVGEMYLRSPALFSGYWDDPEATAKALVADPVEPRSGQRVLRTGDLAYLGDDGGLRFCGRADSQVQIRGNRVELGEVRRRLQGLAGVADAATVVVHDSRGDAELAAFVVVAPEAPPMNERDIMEYCLKGLPAYMAPSRIKLVDALPVTPNGKTDFRKLASELNA